jgi:hypothetical protein
MSDMNEVLLAKWQRWLGQINRDITGLYWDRKIYRQTLQIVKANPHANESNPLWKWMFRNYDIAALLMVRRLIDPHQGTVSLANLVDSISRNPTVIGRESYKGRFSLADRESGWADRCYDSLAGPGQDTVDTRILTEKLESVRCLCSRVKAVVDKMVAHRDEKPPNEMPTYGEVDHAIDAIGDLFKLLYRLVDGGSIGDIEPTEQYDWDWVFFEPWAVLTPSEEDDPAF